MSQNEKKSRQNSPTVVSSQTAPSQQSQPVKPQTFTSNGLPTISIETGEMPKRIHNGRTSKWAYLFSTVLPKLTIYTETKAQCKFIVATQNDISTLRQSIKRYPEYELTTENLGEPNGVRVIITRKRLFNEK